MLILYYNGTNKNVNNAKPHIYVLHYHVCSLASSSTKQSVVFDGSSKMVDDCLLNERLHTGLKFQKSFLMS